MIENANIYKVTTCLENREISGNFTSVSKMSGVSIKIKEMSWKNIIRKNWPKSFLKIASTCFFSFIHLILHGNYFMLFIAEFCLNVF